MSVVYEVEDRPRRGILNLVAMLIAGAAGVGSALVADFVQKGDASAIIVMNSFLNQSLNLNLPLGYLALLLLGAGAMSVFVFEPATKRAAYYTGASILAVLMTTMPVDDLNKALPLFEDILNPGDANTLSPEPANPDGAAFLHQDSFSNQGYSISGSPCLEIKENNMSLIAATYEEAPATNIGCTTGHTSGQAKAKPIAVKGINVTVVIALPKGTMPKIAALLHDEISGQTWSLSRGMASKTKTGYVVRYALTIPANKARAGQLANLHVRCEADGFAIAHVHKKVTTNGPVVMTVTLKKSSTPLWLQKLNTPYHF